jgi:hypothetical protein
MNNRTRKTAGRTIGGQATRDTKAASALTVRRRRERRYAVMVSLALLAIGLGLLLAMTTEFPSSILSRGSSEHAIATSGARMRTATIVLEPIANRCRQVIFDNDTGRSVEINKPCEKTVILDDNGVPIPHGTVRRLDAISKSFLKQ